MGIPSYFSHLLKSHRQIVVSAATIDVLYMDCNSIIYDTIRSSEVNVGDHSAIIREVIRRIEAYIVLLKPSLLSFVAFDGVAPLAKMNQQRERRHRSAFMQYSQEMWDTEFALATASAASNNNMTMSKTKSPSFDTVQITPGTEFMFRLATEIESHVWATPTLVSSSRMQGEGEHKIFAHLRENYLAYSSVGIYGLDADLIMLALSHHHLCLQNIYTIREAPEFRIPVDVPPNTLLFLNIKLLAQSIAHEMGDVDAIHDYIFMCFLLGNDFLPHFPALNLRTHGAHTLLNMYRAHFLRRRLIDGDMRIQWKNVHFLLQELAKAEHTFLLREYKDRAKSAKFRGKAVDTSMEEFFDRIPLLHRGDELFIDPETPGWQSRYYDRVHHTNANSLREKCDAYFAGLEWVFRYYTTGCIDWRWKYDDVYPPLFSDLADMMDVRRTTYFTEENKKNNAYHANTQLVYVVPQGKYDLCLPTGIKYPADIIPHCPVDHLQFQWMFCRHFWESHVVLPHVEIDDLDRLDASWSTV
jgi:5'-3' exonuclease